MVRIFKSILCAIIVIVSAAPFCARAQSISTTQNIDFGEAVVTDNMAQYAVNLQSNGGFTNDPEFSFVSNPQQGIYVLTGAPPSTAIVVTVTVLQQPLGTGEDFVTDNFDINAPATTDLAGEAVINLGARLRTTGTGTGYTSASLFSGQIRIDVTW